MTKRIPMLLFVALLALTAIVHASAQVQPQSQVQTNNKNVLSSQTIAMLVPQRCFSSGSGVTFLKICITDNGNISWFESPAGKVHLQSREGYAICSDIASPAETVHGFDANIAANGWGVSTISQPNSIGTFPLIITRQSLDGLFQFKQTFTLNTGGRDVDIKMDLKNISGVVVPNVRMSRYFDGDIDGAAMNNYSYTRDSDWGKGPEARGLMLTAASSAIVQFTAEVMKYGDWNPFGGGYQYARGCGYAAGASSSPLGDFVGGLHMDLLDLYPGQTRTITLFYRRF